MPTHDDSVLGRGLESLIPQKQYQDPAPAGHASVPGVPEPPLEPFEPSASPLLGATRPHSAPPAAVAVPEPVPMNEAQAELAETAEARAETAPAASASERAGVPGEKFAGAVYHIETEKIRPNPHQPRKTFTEESLKELAASIREFGMLQPIVVRKMEREMPTGVEVDYELIAGERRVMASRLLGLERIPAIIRNVTADQEHLELAVIENIQRENLNPIDLARAYARLQDEFRLTQREIAMRLGKSRETVANTVRLLDLPQDIQNAVGDGRITESHGRLLLTIDDQALQMKLFNDLLENRLTTREFKYQVEQMHGARRRGAPAASAAPVPPEVAALQERLSAELGTPVKIEYRGEPGAGGKISITFYSEEELKSIVGRLGGEE